MKFVLQALLVVALLTPAVARAQAADDVAKARAHYLSGRQLYETGHYQEAIREFSAGYELAKKPRFLYNLALCYRKLGDLPKTRDYLRRFLSLAPPNAPNRHSIEGQLADVEAQLGESPSTPAGTPEPSSAASAAPAPKPVVTAPASAPAQPASTELVATAPPHKSAKRHLAWIIPVTAVVAGVAIGLGVYFGTQGCPATVGCLDAGR